MNEELKVIIKAEIDKLKKGCDDAKKTVEGFKKHTEAVMEKVKKGFSAMGKAAVKVGKTIGKGLAVAAGAFATLAAASLKAKGKLEQALGGAEAVFKEHADFIKNEANNAWKTSGLSAEQYLATANKISALLQGSGFSVKESAQMAPEIIQRAVDVASIMGISLESALDAVTGAAKGNFEMMDNLGVAINDNTLNQYALEKGLNKTTQQMTQQEKIALANQMFLEKTTYAAGNYAKENATLAGSLETAKAAFQNFLSGAGDVKSLVEAGTNAVQVLIKNITEMLPYLATGLQDIIAAIMPQIPILIGQLLPPVIEAAIMLIQGVVQATPQIISTLLEALPQLIEGIQAIIASLIEALPQILENLAGSLPIIIPVLIDALFNVLDIMMQNFSEIIQPIIEALPDIIMSIVDSVLDNLPLLISGVVELVKGIVAALPQIMLMIIQLMPQIIGDVVKGLIDAIPILLAGVGELVSSVWSSIKEFFSGIGEWVGEKSSGLWEGIKKGVKNAFAAIVNFVRRPINCIIGFINKMLGGIESGLNWIIEKINGLSFDIPDWIPGLGGKTIGFNIPKVNIKRIPEIPAMAKGGIVQKSTIIQAGEAGKEAILPLDKNTTWMDTLAKRLNTPSRIILNVDGKTFGEVAINSINGLTRSTGHLDLQIV